MEITVHTGTQGDRSIIHVDWFDHNNVRQNTDVELIMLLRDKPRTLAVEVNGVIVAMIPPKDGYA
jgi:hypothetical protein